MNKAKAILRAVWKFCRYVFVPQRRPKEVGGISEPQIRVKLKGRTRISYI